ncbi:hypothetical protein D3C87_2006730 [compost metagenome]
MQKDGGYEEYSGPLRLYEKAGFAEFARLDGRVGMRKELQGVDGIRAEASGEPVTR